MAAGIATEYRRDIQGLRAIAVVSVVVFHASAGDWLSGGFVGVDVFFVISGFLITRILVKEYEQGRFSLIGFYERRIRRLFPALLAVLSFTLAAAAMLLPPAAYRELAATAVATLLFVSNFAFQKLSGYFAGGAEYKPLLHTWSLAVEEQFYILFPILLFLLQRFARGTTGAVLSGLAVLSLGLSIWATYTHPNAAFYLAPSRAFELLIGATAAYYSPSMPRLGQRLYDGLSILGLVIIVASISLIDDSVAFPGAVALAPCLGTALVILSGRDRPSLGGRLINSTPFVFFGNISYSLYLWHWPLLVLANHWMLVHLHPAHEAGVVLLSILIAYASWMWIERPFIVGLPKIRVLATASAATAGVSALCTALFLLHGLPQRFGRESQVFFTADQDYNHERPHCHSEEGNPISYDRNCVFGAPGVAPSVAIWADSHGAELAVALGERLAPARDAVMQITASACPPVIGYTDSWHPDCARHNNEMARSLASDSRIGKVVILAHFGRYSTAQSADFERGFELTIRTLIQAGKRVIIFEPIPVFDYDAPTALGLVASRGGDPSAWGLPLTTYRERNAPFLALIARVAKATGAMVVPTADLLCQDGICSAFARGEGVLYFNADHLSVTGARRIAIAVPLEPRCNTEEPSCNQNRD